MTRINTIHPKHLTNEWLLAEWRELPRIVNELEKYPNRFNKSKIPSQYKLAGGHVMFFRDKLLFLAKRHRLIKKELSVRGIKHSHKIKVELHYLSPSIKKQACNDWTPSSRDHKILIERLDERFLLRKKSYSVTDSEGIKTKIDCDDSYKEYKASWGGVYND